jgi:hypothetical protein
MTTPVPSVLALAVTPASGAVVSAIPSSMARPVRLVVLFPRTNFPRTNG